MTEIIQEIRHESGIPLGGIGTGSVEIRPDGLFHEWQIFNTGHWSPNSPCSSAKNAEVPLDSFLFYVRTRTPDGRITVRHLALHSPLNDLYSFPWIRCVKRIRFEGHFPVARLVFEDPDLPVEVILEAFSP